MLFLVPFLSVAQAYVALDFEKSHGDDLVKRDVQDVKLINSQKAMLYNIQLSVGTPPQNITAQLDTGSSDLWFPDSTNPYCKANKKQAPKSIASLDAGTRPTSPAQVPKSLRNLDCAEFGLFNSSASTTFNSNKTEFFISYLDSSYAEGVWATDNLYLNGLNISGSNFGLAYFSNSSNSVLGVGLTPLEASYDTDIKQDDSPRFQYPNFPQILKQKGAISKVTYSLYLNDTKSKYGQISFGGVDHSKYVGQLYTIPLVNSKYQKSPGVIADLEVTLNGLGIRDNTTNTNTTLYTQKSPALFDSGTSYSYVPYTMAQVIASQVNGTIDNKTEAIRSPKCPSKKDTREVVFNFNGVEIAIPLKQFYQKKSGKCYLDLMVAPPNNGPGLSSGDTFLRQVYTVFDLEAQELSIARANFNSSSPADVEEIKSTVPSAIKAPQYYNTFSAYDNATQVVGNIFDATATASMAPKNQSNSSNLSRRALNYENNSARSSTSSIVLVLAAITTLFM